MSTTKQEVDHEADLIDQYGDGVSKTFIDGKQGHLWPHVADQQMCIPAIRACGAWGRWNTLRPVRFALRTTGIFWSPWRAIIAARELWKLERSVLIGLGLQNWYKFWLVQIWKVERSKTCGLQLQPKSRSVQQFCFAFALLLLSFCFALLLLCLLIFSYVFYTLI